jgi:ketosteroid isomerase-like protein
MSRENVEVLRRFWETVATSNLDAAVAGFIDVLAPDIEWHVLLPDGTYRGREAVLKFLGEFQEAFSAYHVHAEEFVDAGDKVVVVLRERARGRASGAETEHILIQVSTFRDGQIARIDEYSDRAEAFEAVGLAE